MNIVENSELFDSLHEGMLRGIFVSIKTVLEESEILPDVVIPEEYIEGIVETIAFNVAAVIDGSAVLEHEGKDVQPYLAFKDGTNIVVNKSGSYLHEMVMGYLDELNLDEL